MGSSAEGGAEEGAEWWEEGEKVAVEMEVEADVWVERDEEQDEMGEEGKQVAGEMVGEVDVWEEISSSLVA